MHKSILSFLFVAAGVTSCGRESRSPAPAQGTPAPTNRIAVPDSVRRNLGIEFVAVQRRRIASTVRLAGAFELVPTARQELRTPVSGRVTLLVEPLQSVAAGSVVARIDSPQWREHQRELGEIATQSRVHAARLEALKPLLVAHRSHEDSLGSAIEVLLAREQQLLETQVSLGGQARELAETRSQLALLRSSLAEAHEKGAETEATIAEARAQLDASRDRFGLAIDSAVALTGVAEERLLAAGREGQDAAPVWRTLAAIEVRSAVAGVVDQLDVVSGAWLEDGALLGSVSDLARVRFRARALQSDLMRLSPGLPATALPALGGTTAIEPLPGALLLGADGDARQRTIDVFLIPSEARAWARPGIAGFLEVETSATSEPVLAIPLASTLRDGLDRVLFRRAPDDADSVLRLEADLGLDDGRWVEVKSGLVDGDHVVMAGAYELVLATSGSMPKGGHFHADGTFHEGEDK